MNDRQSVRNLALSFGIGAVAALVFDVLLQNALAAVRSPGLGSSTPWWMIGRVVERGIWVVAALLAWAFSTPLSQVLTALWPSTHVVDRRAALSTVGKIMVAAPLLLIVASWIVLAMRVTLEGTWSSEGRVFLTTSYYSNVLLAYSPWAAGGIVLLTLRRHAGA